MENLINEAKRMQHLAGIITESQLDEGFNDFNAVGWTARIKEIAKEMGYQPSLASSQKIGEQAAAEASKKNEKKSYTYTETKSSTGAGENKIVAIFSIDQKEKEQNKQDIQKKVIDVYKNDADVKVAEETYGDTVMTVIIKEKSQPQAESLDIEEIVNEALKAVRK